MGSVQLVRHPPLGDGDGLSQSAALGRGVRARLQVRRPHRAAVHRSGTGLRARRSTRVRRAHPEQPPDLRRRGVVVLRLPGAARATSCSRSAGSTTTKWQRRNSPGPRCSRAETPSTPTSTAPWWRASGRPRSATSTRKPRSAACSKASSATSNAGRQLELEESREAAPRLARVESARCLAAFRRSKGRRHAAASCHRPAQHRQLHHRVPGVPLQHLGHIRLGRAARRRGPVGLPGSGLG